MEVLGETLYDSGNIDQSELIFRHLVSLDSNNSTAKIMLADILNENGDTDSALLLLEEIPENDDKYLAVLMQKADIYQTIGMEEVSESLLKQALEISPNNKAINFGMAELFYSEGKYQNAIDYYKKILDDGVVTYLNQNIKIRYANCLAFTGNFEKAAKIYEHFNNLVLHDDDLLAKGTVFYELHQPRKAAESLEVIRERTPDYSSLYLILSKCYEELGELDKAYQIAQKGCEINEFDPRIYIEFAGLAQRLGYTDQAINGYNKILENDPENIQVLINLSNLYLNKNDETKVIELLDGNESLDPQLAWNLGRAYLNKDQLKPANENLLSVFDQYKDDPDYLIDVIDLFKSQRNLKALITLMQLYLKIRPTDDKIAEEYEELKSEQELDD